MPLAEVAQIQQHPVLIMQDVQVFNAALGQVLRFAQLKLQLLRRKAVLFQQAEHIAHKAFLCGIQRQQVERQRQVGVHPVADCGDGGQRLVQEPARECQRQLLIFGDDLQHGQRGHHLA